MDFLAENLDKTSLISAQEVIQRVIPNLAHSNPAVVLSATKVILQSLEELKDPDMVKSVCRKLAPTLISCMNNGPEIQFVTIRNIQLIL